MPTTSFQAALEQCVLCLYSLGTYGPSFYFIIFHYIQKYGPPPLNWSTPIVRNWRIKYENLIGPLYCPYFTASPCRAISATACSKLSNQSRLKLYHYTRWPRLQLGRGSGFYMRVEADDRTRHHRKQRRAQCVESSDHCVLANACVMFVQDQAWSLLSVPYIEIPDQWCAVVLVSYVILFLFSGAKSFGLDNDAHGSISFAVRRIIAEVTNNRTTGAPNKYAIASTLNLRSNLVRLHVFITHTSQLINATKSVRKRHSKNRAWITPSILNFITMIVKTKSRRYSPPSRITLYLIVKRQNVCLSFSSINVLTYANLSKSLMWRKALRFCLGQRSLDL